RTFIAMRWLAHALPHDRVGHQAIPLQRREVDPNRVAGEPEFRRQTRDRRWCTVDPRQDLASSAAEQTPNNLSVTHGALSLLIRHESFVLANKTNAPPRHLSIKHTVLLTNG